MRSCPRIDFSFLYSSCLRDVVRGAVREGQPAFAVDGHAVLGQRQVFGREPEVDRVLRDLLERPAGCELRLDRLLAAEHRRLRLPDHLDVPERIVVVVAAEVEVVQPERLLEDRRVLVARERQHRLARVEHVVAADLVGAVREAVRVLVVRRREEQGGGVRGTRGEHDDVGRVTARSRRRARRRPRSRPCRPRSSPASRALAFVSSVTFECSSAGRTPSTSASDFPCTAQGKPSQFWQRTQTLYGMFGSLSLIPHGAWNGR